MGSASEFDNRRIPTEQRLDISKVLLDRDLVALSLVAFVPLVVIVENQRNDVEKVVDETVWRCGIDQSVKPAVEIRKIVIARQVIELAGEGGAVQMNGMMIDWPVLERARRIVSLSYSFGDRS